MRLVVDTSVAVKWFVPEVHSAAAVRLLNEGNQFLAPDLIGPELGNTLWKKVRRGELAVEEAQQIMVVFQMIDVEIAPSMPLLPAALELATALDRTVYDCVYLALALATDSVLITSDEKFRAAISASPLAASIFTIDAPG